MLKQIIDNVKKEYAYRSWMESMGRREEICLAVITELYPLIEDLIIEVATGPVYQSASWLFDGVVEAKTRRCSIASNVDYLVDTSLDVAAKNVAENLAEEFRQHIVSYRKNSGQTNAMLVPYVLLSDAGVVIDPITFIPMVSWITRFMIVTPNKTIGSSPVSENQM